MQRTRALVFLVGVGFALAGRDAAAADAPPPAPAAVKPSSPYVPPPPEKRLSGGRVGGGTRSIRPTRCATKLTVLVPEDHGGLTGDAQPTLYYYVAADTDCSVQFVLNDRRQVPPLVETSVLRQGRAGFHAISLRDLGITLERGVDYDWFVQLQPPAPAAGGTGAPEAFSGGQIRRVEAGPATGATASARRFGPRPAVPLVRHGGRDLRRQRQDTRRRRHGAGSGCGHRGRWTRIWGLGPRALTSPGVGP